MGKCSNKRSSRQVSQLYLHLLYGGKMRRILHVFYEYKTLYYTKILFLKKSCKTICIVLQIFKTDICILIPSGSMNIKVARSTWNLRFILLYPLAGLFEYLFLCLLHRHLPAKQALKFKTVRQRVWKNNSRDFKKIWQL